MAFLINPANMPTSEFQLSVYIKELVEKHGYKFNKNTYNIQGNKRNGHIVDSACSELVILRIANRKMSDEDLYNLCVQLGGKKILAIVKELL
jgi:predicted secreted protein